MQHPTSFPALSHRFLFSMAVLVLVLNVLDASLTLVWVLSGHAAEANPLMEQLLSHGPLPFAFAKMALVSLGIGLLWRLRWRPSARLALIASALTYTLVIAHHMHGAGTIIAAQ